MATIVQIIGALQDVTGAITGVKTAPDYPPEGMAQFPFVVAYPIRVESQLNGAAWSEDFITMRIEFHLARGILPKATEAAYPYFERFRNALFNNPTLTGTIHTPHGQERPVVGTFGYLAWTGNKGRPENHIGWRFEVVFKTSSTLS